MAVKTFATLSANFAARYPNASAGTVESISAAAGTVPAIDAAAVRGFAALSSKLQWVRAKEHFLQSGELIQVGDTIQVEEDDAKRLRTMGRADFVTDDEVNAAQAAQAPTGKGKA